MATAYILRAQRYTATHCTTHCNPLQPTATHCNVSSTQESWLHNVCRKKRVFPLPKHCNVLQVTATQSTKKCDPRNACGKKGIIPPRRKKWNPLKIAEILLKKIVLKKDMLTRKKSAFPPRQNTATYCNSLQHAATRCNILQKKSSRKIRMERRAHFLSEKFYCKILRLSQTHCNKISTQATKVGKWRECIQKMTQFIEVVTPS